MPTVVVMFTVCAIAFIGLAIPLMGRKVPPNAIYGLRIPATFADEDVWYDANAASGRDLLLLGVVGLVLALALPLLGVAEEAYALVLTGTLTAGTLVMLVAGWRRANRMLREKG